MISARVVQVPELPSSERATAETSESQRSAVPPTGPSPMILHPSHRSALGALIPILLFSFLPFALDGSCRAEPVRTMQTPSSAPEQVAKEYLDAVERMHWEAVVSRLHRDALSSFRSYLEALLFGRVDPRAPAAEAVPLETPARMEGLETLTGAGSVEAFLALSDAEVFVQALRALQADSPGMMNAWVDRTTEILGSVPEADTLAHVVYRLEWRLTGATPDTEILTVRRLDGEGWRVYDSRELESIRPALGSVILRAPGPGPSDP